MPTNAQRAVGIAATVVIFVGGAWLASQVPSSMATGARSHDEPGDELTVEVAGVRNASGKVVVMLYKDRATYDPDRPSGYRELDPAERRVEVRFSDVGAGPVYIVAYHDENGDRDYGSGEGFATSAPGNAHRTPPLEEAWVADRNLSITMHYPE